MLFILCTWHAYAKLRLHTSSTFQSLEETTQSLGEILCLFVKEVCSSYTMKSLPAEEAAQTWCRAKNAAKGKPLRSSHHNGDASFNMSTYKLHALGDYVATIWCYWTTDNYSTQVVSNLKLNCMFFFDHKQGKLEHCHIKRFYPQTNKQLTFTQQISTHHWWQQILHKIQE